MTVDLDLVERMAATETGLCTAAIARGDGSVLATVVNAGLLRHPVDGLPVVGFVTRGDSVKHGLIRSGARVTLTFRRGWQYATVEGPADLVGPDDEAVGVDEQSLRQLLRDVFTAAGGTHDDWDEYDRVMAQERRAVVMLRPERVYGQG